MRAKVWLLFTLAVLLFVESDSQYIRRRRKKVLPVQQNGHNRPRPVQEKQMSIKTNQGLLELLLTVYSEGKL